MIDGSDYEKAKQILETCPLNSNGHFEPTEGYFAKDYRSRLVADLFLYRLKDGELLDISNGNLTNPVHIGHTFNCCYYCAEKTEYQFDGTTLSIISPCKYAGGAKEVITELNVPSGKIVFANDLRRWFRVIGEQESINYQLGMLQVTQAYEKVGMAHAYS